MIYTVTFNPSLDYVVMVKEFYPGQVNRTEKECIYAGGKGINVSIVLKNLGLDSIATGFIAGFTGEQIKHLVQEMGLRQDFIEVKSGCSRINVKIRSGIESEINGKGPLVTRQEAESLYQQLKPLKDGDVLVLAGSVPEGLSNSVYMDIMKQVQERHIKVVVDAAGSLLMNVLPYRPFLIKPNRDELGALFGRTFDTRDAVIPYARRLRGMGARNVLVSLAGEGAVLVTEEDRVFVAKAPKGKVLNSVGAGDSMVAGFLAGYLKHRNYEEALKMGVCAGSASAFSEKLAVRQEVEQLMEKYEVR